MASHRPTWYGPASWLHMLIASGAFMDLSHASNDAFMSSGEYNAGEYGHYITQTFHSSPVIAARPNFLIPFKNCDDGMKLFVAPRVHKVKALAYEAAMIFDTNGDFIWAPSEEYGNTYNFQVQTYRGEPHLFFWAGNDRVKGHGKGHYYVFNKHYEHVQTVSAGNGLFADLHTFAMTRNDSAVCSIYNERPLDLSDLPDSKYTTEVVWDGVFQEIDLKSGKLLFEWHAADHINVTESYNVIHDDAKKPWKSKDDPWDFFHINMIEKDDSGNYLVSSRHLRALLYVDGRDGHIIWRLGGKRSDFTDLSGGNATNFMGQHDAHWVDDSHTAITLFDNGRDWQGHSERPSRGMRINVDLEHMTVELAQVVEHPFASIKSESQGSYQTLPNGNIVLGYGYNAVMTEFSADGTLLCDAWWMPQGDFGTGSVQSYRNLKFHWVGLPKTPPSLVFQDSNFYVSWSGATEVTTWTLYHSTTSTGVFDVMLSFPKNGFETQYVLQDITPVRQFVRVVAFDKDGNNIGVSKTIDLGDKATQSKEIVKALKEHQKGASGRPNNSHWLGPSVLLVGRSGPGRVEIILLSMLGVILTLSLLALAYWAFRVCRARKQRSISATLEHSHKGWHAVPLDERDETESDMDDDGSREKDIKSNPDILSSPTISTVSDYSRHSSRSSIVEASTKWWPASLSRVLPTIKRMRAGSRASLKVVGADPETPSSQAQGLLEDPQSGS